MSKILEEQVMQKERPYQFVQLLPSQLKTDSFYQRNLSNSHLKYLVQYFDINLFSPPIVNKRADGNYYTVDGDHRIRAWFTKFGDKPVLCKVYAGLSRDEEANMFLVVNNPKANKGIAASERLNTMLNLNDPEVTDMVNAAELCGVKISFGNGSHQTKSTCFAPDAMFNVYKTYGREILIQVLQTIIAAWNGKRDGLRSGFVQGLALFYNQYSGKFDKKTLIRVLQRNTTDYYIRESKGFSGKIAARYCAVFLREYNFNRSKNRIE